MDPAEDSVPPATPADGSPPSGKGGGTADTVQEAREAGIPVDVVWPDGAARRGRVTRS